MEPATQTQPLQLWKAYRHRALAAGARSVPANIAARRAPRTMYIVRPLGAAVSVAVLSALMIPQDHATASNAAVSARNAYSDGIAKKAVCRTRPIGDITQNIPTGTSDPDNPFQIYQIVLPVTGSTPTPTPTPTPSTGDIPAQPTGFDDAICRAHPWACRNAGIPVAS